MEAKILPKKFHKITNVAYRTNLITHCGNCGNPEIRCKTGAFYGVCNRCDAVNWYFNPTEMQQLMIDDDSMIKIKCAVVRSGKTVGSVYEMCMHAFNIKSAVVLCLAPTIKQVEQIIRPEILKFIAPKDILELSNERITLRNGSRINFITSKNISSLKGYTASFALCIEANFFAHSIYQELISRLSNSVGYEYQRDANGVIVERDNKPVIVKNHNKIILECNPEPSWVIDEAMKANTIYYTNNIPIDNYKNRWIPHNQQIAVSFEDIDSLVHQPESYINSQKGKYSKEEKDLMQEQLYCVVNNNNKKILPYLDSVIISPFKLDQDAYVMTYATDFGANIANTTMYAVAYNVNKKIFYIVDEYYRNNLPREMNAKEMLAIKSKYNFCHEAFHVCDPAGKQTEVVKGQNAIHDYRKNGIYMQAGSNAQEGIVTLNHLMKNKKLFVFSNCVNLIKESESLMYEYKEVNGIRVRKIPTENRSLRADALDTMKYWANKVGSLEEEWDRFDNRQDNITYGNIVGNCFIA